MPTNNKQKWIEKGYEMAGIFGIDGLKIEPLAKIVGKSKSSFYHHFADLDLFVEQLLQHHLHQAKQIAEKEKKAQNINPDLIQILCEHKTDLLFNRQLRIHRSCTMYDEILLQTDQFLATSFIQIWVKDLGLQLSENQLEAIFGLALENFFLQINSENLNEIWLTSYFSNLKIIVEKLAFVR